MSNSLEQVKQPLKELANKAKSSPEAKGSCCSFGFIISITYIAIGAVYLHDCPVQEMIPIYLIVMGTLYIISSPSACLPCTEDPENCLNKFFKFWMPLVSIFTFCWFIAGNYWIYSVFEPSYNKNGTDVSSYCNKTLYLFSFWTTTLFYMVLGFIVVICCCGCFCMCCLCANNSDGAGDNPPRESAQKDKESNSVV